MRLSDKRYEEIKMDIAVTFEDYNVNGLPIDVFGLAKKMGVIVVYASQIIKKNKGKINEFMLFSYPPSYLYYSKEKQKFFVYIDDVGTNKSRQRFSMAHELMHIILGHTEQNERNEAEADFGAQYMLAPTSLILLAPDHWLLEETDFIKFVFDVSEPVAEITIRYNHNRLYYVSLEEKPYEEIINNQLGPALNHKQVKSIDFGHPHGKNKVVPHVHYNMVHDNNEPGTSPSESDWQLISKIKKGLGIS